MKISKKQNNTMSPFTFRLSKSEHQRVSNLADELGLRKSQVVREAVHSFIQANK